MRTRINALTIISLILVITGLGYLVPKFFEPADIWWTPQSLALSLQESRDRVEVLVGGELLRKRVEDGSLLLKSADGSSRPVGAGDLGFRFNNWDARRADLYWEGMFSAAYVGIGVVMLAAGLFLVPRIPRAAPPTAAA